jgi:5'-methylthioadenosine phosphorylase
MSPPETHGHRLGIVVGSGVSAGALAGDDAVTVAVEVGPDHHVEVLDAGSHVVLDRHGGPDGPVPAHRVDHHANIRALCVAGCDRVIGLASVGSLRLDWGAGTVVALHDVFALGCSPTFHDGVEGHRVAGFDPGWRSEVLDAWRHATPTPVADGGVYAMAPGPRFETPAEIRFLASVADVVGMTIPPEMVLASEAGLLYVGLCQVDNLGNGLEGMLLDVEDYRANVASSAERLAGDLQALLAELHLRSER